MENFIKQFSFIALENIFRELPNKITHSFNDIKDIKPPKLMYPIFYGSYDWHSSAIKLNCFIKFSIFILKI